MQMILSGWANQSISASLISEHCNYRKAHELSEQKLISFCKDHHGLRINKEMSKNAECRTIMKVTNISITVFIQARHAGLK